jgi:hypothetical protein
MVLTFIQLSNSYILSVQSFRTGEFPRFLLYVLECMAVTHEFPSLEVPSFTLTLTPLFLSLSLSFSQRMHA